MSNIIVGCILVNLDLCFAPFYGGLETVGGSLPGSMLDVSNCQQTSKVPMSENILTVVLNSKITEAQGPHRRLRWLPHSC